VASAEAVLSAILIACHMLVAWEGPSMTPLDNRCNRGPRTSPESDLTTVRAITIRWKSACQHARSPRPVRVSHCPPQARQRMSHQWIVRTILPGPPLSVRRRTAVVGSARSS